MNRFGECLLNLNKVLLFRLFLGCISTSAMATILTPVLPLDGVVEADNNKFIDPRVDYSRFMGRVTDKSDSGKILKVKVENNNTKFLKAGDIIFFKVNNHDHGKFCKASIRAIEDLYFSMYVRDFDSCWSSDKYFTRGMQLNFKTKKLEQRVFEASHYREILILRKEGFLNQLNEINHFLWTFDQQRLKVASKYDEQINILMREKQLALDNLLHKKQENILLQNELAKKLDTVDESLDHYTIERQEYLVDRWNMDHEQDLPFGRRPQKLKRK